MSNLFFTFSNYISAAHFSQFPTKESSELSTLEQILFFWLQNTWFTKWQRALKNFFSLSQKQELFENHLARAPFIPNEERTNEMQDDVVPCVGAQGMETNGYRVSDLEDIEFHWEDTNLNMDAVFRQDLVTPFSFSTV